MSLTGFSMLAKVAKLQLDSSRQGTLVIICANEAATHSLQTLS